MCPAHIVPVVQLYVSTTKTGMRTGSRPTITDKLNEYRSNYENNECVRKSITGLIII